MATIKGNQDGPNGRNETYRVGKRPSVPRAEVVKEVEAGLHPGYHIITVDARKYVRDNPDASKKDNVDS